MSQGPCFREVLQAEVPSWLSIQLNKVSTHNRNNEKHRLHVVK